MEKPTLKPINANEPVMGKRKCGHYEGYTLDLTVLYKDGTGHITSYCAMCIIEKLGIPPCAEHKLIVDEQNPQGRLEKIWSE